MAVELERLSWEQFGVASRTLAQAVADDGFQPDLILSIARGGLLPAGALSYALNVKNLHVMNVEFYTGVDERLELPVVLPPVLDRVDLTDVASVRTAVIYEKPRSLVRCDYVWRRTDRWIDFPWSAEPPVRRRPRPAE